MVSKECIDFVKQWEGCKLKAYQDGGGVWTCGYGTTGPDVTEGTTFTQEHADLRLIQRLNELDSTIRKACQQKLTENQYTALISFAYNAGLGSLLHSKLWMYTQSGNFGAAADQFPKWDHDNGKVVAGLANRRAAERQLFLS